MTDKSFCDRLPRPALKVRANSGKSSEEDCKGLATRFNGFHPVSPDFESRAGEQRSHQPFSTFVSQSGKEVERSRHPLELHRHKQAPVGFVNGFKPSTKPTGADQKPN